MRLRTLAFAFSAAAALCACRTDAPSDSAVKETTVVTVTEKTLNGPAANAFLQALIDAGLSDQSGTVGAQTIKAMQITCSQAVVPHPQPNCQIAWDQGTVAATPEGAKVLYQTLASNGGAVSQGHLVGSSKVLANSIACSRPVVPNAQANCLFTVGATISDGSGDTPNNNPPGTGTKKTLVEAKGEAFMKALQDAGLVDTTGLIGASNLTATAVTCSQAVVLHPQPGCQIIWKDGAATATASKDGAKVLFSALANNGGGVNQGNLVGSAKVRATTVICSRPVVPNALGSCSFYVGATN